jgi:hypothetical protein
MVRVVEGLQAPGSVAAAAAVAANSQAVLLIGTFPKFAASMLVVQHASPALVVAGTGEAKKSEMHCIALQGQCLPCFGLVRVRYLHTSTEADCPVAIRRAVVLVWVERLSQVQYLMSFLVASALPLKAAIRHCSTEDLWASLDRGLEVSFLTEWVLL